MLDVNSNDVKFNKKAGFILSKATEKNIKSTLKCQRYEDSSKKKRATRVASRS